MSLRNKPLEIVDELKIALLHRQPAQRASRLRRLGTEIKMSLRSKPLEMVDELKGCA
jgi:hypothetical protein